jgi:hypothetical protein
MDINKFYYEMYKMEVQLGSLSVWTHFYLLTIRETSTQFGFGGLPPTFFNLIYPTLIRIDWM